MKRCPDCGEVKPLESFCRNRNTRDGRATYCKPCHNARNRETIRRLYGNTRHYHLRQRYGIGAAEVEELIRRQGGVCAICEQEPATQVDHDKRTGEVRGILCDGCNGGLSAFALSAMQGGQARGGLRPQSISARWIGILLQAVPHRGNESCSGSTLRRTSELPPETSIRHHGGRVREAPQAPAG